MKKRARSQRGAVMVEAAVLLPVIGLFFGLTIWMMASYYRKMTQMQTARYDVSYYAANGCQRSKGNANANESQNVGTGTAGEMPTQNGGSAPPPPETGSALNESKSIASETNEQEVKKSGYTRTIKNSAHMMCNEQHFGGNVKSVINYAKSFM